MQDKVMTRRRFFSRLSLALSAAAAAVVSVPALAYLLGPLIRPARQAWRDLGPVAAYNVGETVRVAIEDPSPLPWAGQTTRTAAYVRRTGEDAFVVFAVNCTHLGCPVNWLPEAQLFLCPCHGGVFYANGDVAGGPPARPLFRYESRIENGHLLILTRPLPVT